MSVYAAAVFLHIVGALAMFAAIALEWASVLNLRRATAATQAHEWARLLDALRRIGGPAVLTLLVTGIYMSATRWGSQGWINVGFGGLLLIALVGVALSGRRAGAVVRAVAAEAGSRGAISAALATRLRDPVLVVSAWLRTALALGVVLIMTVKPSGSAALSVLGGALALGLGAASPTWGRGRRVAPVPAPARQDPLGNLGDH